MVLLSVTIVRGRVSVFWDLADKAWAYVLLQSECIIPVFVSKGVGFGAVQSFSTSRLSRGWR